MSTVVCQSSMSCLEPQLPETTTKLVLKVAPLEALDSCKNPGTDHNCPPAEVKASLDFGNWGFIQTIPKESGDKESFYTHPLAAKPLFSRLSEKSLALCTEQLGSETGTDIVTDGSSIFSTGFSPSTNSSETSLTSYERVDLHDWEHKPKSTGNLPNKEGNSCRGTKSFPPPLTTMSGSSSLQVRRHREDGRLIIEVVEAPFRNSYLQAERSDGRLRLSFSKAPNSWVEATSSAGREREGEEEEKVEEYGDACDGEMAAEEQIEEDGLETESENKEEFDGGENNLEVGMEKFQRPSRCKEGTHGNKGLYCNWKPHLWVATS